MTKEIKPYSPFQEWVGMKFIKNYARFQVRLYEISGGRLANQFMGCHCAILTTEGRKSGKKRKSPLLYIEDGNRVVLAATKGGMTSNPVWYLNIIANPEVEIQIGNKKRKLRARQASPEEAAKLWPKLDENYAGYAEYRERLKGKREAPVIILEES